MWHSVKLAGLVGEPYEKNALEYHSKTCKNKELQTGKTNCEYVEEAKSMLSVTPHKLPNTYK